MSYIPSTSVALTLIACIGLICVLPNLYRCAIKAGAEYHSRALRETNLERVRRHYERLGQTPFEVPTRCTLSLEELRVFNNAEFAIANSLEIAAILRSSKPIEAPPDPLEVDDVEQASKASI